VDVHFSIYALHILFLFVRWGVPIVLAVTTAILSPVLIEFSVIRIVGAIVSFAALASIVNLLFVIRSPMSARSFGISPSVLRETLSIALLDLLLLSPTRPTFSTNMPFLADVIISYSSILIIIISNWRLSPCSFLWPTGSDISEGTYASASVILREKNSLRKICLRVAVCVEGRYFRRLFFKIDWCGSRRW
jgi:hypothetical protein